MATHSVPPEVSSGVNVREGRAPDRPALGWISIFLVAIGILVLSIHSRDGGVPGIIERLTFLSADVVSLLALGSVLLGIVAGWVSRRSLPGRIGLWVGVGYFVISLAAGLLIGVFGAS